MLSCSPPAPWYPCKTHNKHHLVLLLHSIAKMRSGSQNAMPCLDGIWAASCRICAIMTQRKTARASNLASSFSGELFVGLLLCPGGTSFSSKISPAPLSPVQRNAPQ